MAPDMSDTLHNSCGKPGRLAPRWLHDLFAGDLTDADGQPGGYFMGCQTLLARLTLPKMQAKDGKQTENGSVPSGKDHELLLVETQCLDTERGEILSCMCKHCKYHFVFDFKKGPSHTCSASEANLLCHLVLVGSSKMGAPPEKPGRWCPQTQVARWECSATRCTVEVEVSISMPRMQVEHIEWIVDEERIRRQRQQALAQDPERFANLNENLETKSLLTMNAYLRDSLAHTASSEPKKVAARNKVFVVQFGPESLPIFTYLGFTVSTINGEEYLILPHPPSFPGKTPIGSQRAFYEDARSEIMALIEDTGREQVMIHSSPAKARLERALSCYNHIHTAKPKPHDDPRDFKALGAPMNSSDDLLQFAFACQLQTDSLNKRSYYSALKNLATSRGDDIRMYVGLQASLEETGPPVSLEETRPRLSLGEVAPQLVDDPLVQAYEHFGLAPNGSEEEVLAIRRYQVACHDYPEHKKTHRQMLFRIGRARNSQAMKNVACNFTDFREACQFLDVEGIVDPSADVLMSFCEMQIRDGKEPFLIAAAMDTIADRINSSEMKERAQHYRYLGDQPDQLTGTLAHSESATCSIDSTNMNLPLGLDNLRNTCYLNSILQYFFTVKAVRNVVLNFDPNEVPSTEATRGNGEVYLGREFVVELKKLFSELDSATASFVKPQQRLANAAWISVDKVQKDEEKAALSGKPQPTPRPLPTRPVPPVPRPGATAKPTVTVDSVADSSETASISSSQTLTNLPDASSDFSFENLVFEAGADETTVERSEAQKPDGDSPRGVEKLSSDALIEALEGALAQTEIKGTEQMDVEEVMGRCINHLRAAINPASVTNANEVGGQRDEIMENLYITFANLRKEKDAPKYKRHTSQERWVTANPAASGPLSLYRALDGYFEREFIGDKLVSFTSIVTAPPIFHICIQRSQVGGGKNTNPVIIPEVLYLDRYMESDEDSELSNARKRSWDIKAQLKEMERSGDNQGANNNADPLAVFMGTRGTDVSGLALKGVANSSGTVSEGDVNMSGLAAEGDATLSDSASDGGAKLSGEASEGDANLSAMAWEKDEEGYEMIDSSLKDVLDRHGKPLASVATAPGLTDGSGSSSGSDEAECAGTEAAQVLDNKMSSDEAQLRSELDNLFVDMKTHKYCLHSVICHAGQTAKSGHYWVWIFDFEQNIWRKYNDRTVTENANTQAVLDELSTKGEPYYVMYVRDEDKNDLVSIPRLRQYAGEPSDIEMVDDIEPNPGYLEEV